MQLKNNKGRLAKWFNNFGFIKFENRDVFVHRENYLPGFLPEVGQIVAFDFGLSPNPIRPPQAINVRVVKSAAAIQAEDQMRAGLEALQNQQGGAQ